MTKQEMELAVKSIERTLNTLTDLHQVASTEMVKKYREYDYRMGNYYEGQKIALDLAISIIKIGLGK